MNSEIMEEWLHWFDSQMTGRKVVLLMDNFSAHETAVKAIRNTNLQLQNTLIIWLPANSTSRFQPLDQGIIQSWKSYWKCQWVAYLLHEYDAGRDPVPSMNVLKAVRWAISTWELDLKTSTIERCFHKALKEPGLPSDSMDPVSMDREAAHNVEIGLLELQKSLHIREVMDINQFLNPDDENIEDSLEELDALLLAKYGPEVEAESDEEEEILPRIRHEEAIVALQRLRLYAEQQDNSRQGLFQALNLEERDIKARQLKEVSQSDIRRYFSIESAIT